jgi:hypothetical protein
MPEEHRHFFALELANEHSFVTAGVAKGIGDMLHGARFI